MIRFLDLPAQYESIRAEVDRVMGAVIGEAAFAGGRFVDAFERQFAAYVGAEHCIGVANGTDALEVAIWSLDLPPRSEIIVPANSFVATAEAVVNASHIPVFADCGEDYTIDLESAEELVWEKTRAIIPVHLYGQCANMDEVNRFAKKHGLFVIEDAAQAHGAEDRGTRAGSLSGTGTFSFYPGKILGAYGDGGAIVTNDPVRADRMRQHANHGRDGARGHVMAGRNSRLDGIQAAVLSVKLQHVDEWILKRQDQARLYGRLLEGLPLRLPLQREGVRHVYHLFVIRTTLADRSELRAFLDDRGVQTGLHYARCIPEWPAFSGYRAVAENARRWQDQLLSLPIGEHLNVDEIHSVSETLRSFF